MSRKPLVIVTGYNIRYPLGGQVAHNLNILIGLQRLGCDVWYVEECGSWGNSCYNPSTGEMSSDPTFGIEYLKRTLKPFGLERQWLFVDESRRYHNLTAEETLAVCRKADLLFTVSSVTWLPEFLECKRRLYLDTDPGVTQFQMSAERAPSVSGFASPYDHQFHYTVGLNIGQPGCVIPTWGLHWRPCFPPVVLDLFPNTYRREAERFTTVMSWASRKPIVFNGVEYGPKSQEFLRFITLPKPAGDQFEIAVGGTGAPKRDLRHHGWHLRDPLEVTRDWETYRDFIGASRGEWSAATNLVVATRSGWFSDRSAVYLAMGKPIIVQDTNVKRVLPPGKGFVPFQTLEEVLHAIDDVNADYENHCKAARRLAEEHLDSDKVLGRVLRDVGLPGGV